MTDIDLEEPAPGVFVLYCDYEDRFVAKEAGLRWHRGERCRAKTCVACDHELGLAWWTQNVLHAFELAEYAAEELATDLEQRAEVATQQQAVLEEAQAEVDAERDAWKAETLELSRLRSVDLDVPVPEELEYLPYQKVGIAYALSRPHTLIADEMGLGKTVEALGVLNATPEARRVLVVCPASLKLNWLREAERWLVGDRTLGVAGKDVPRRGGRSDHQLRHPHQVGGEAARPLGCADRGRVPLRQEQAGQALQAPVRDRRWTQAVLGRVRRS